MLHNMRVLVVGEHFFIISKMNKTSCFKSRHFINIYIINRTLHGRLGIRILSSRAESISHSFASLTRERYFQHSKIKFLSPRGHVISSIYAVRKIGIPRKNPKYVETRNFKHFKENSFKIDLINAQWPVINTISCVNEAWGKWKSVFLNILNKHPPKRIIRVRNKPAPWLNSKVR